MRGAPSAITISTTKLMTFKNVIVVQILTDLGQTMCSAISWPGSAVQRRSCKHCGTARCTAMLSIKPSGTLLIIFGSKSGGGDFRMMCAHGPLSGNRGAWETITMCLRALGKTAEENSSGCTKSSMSLRWSNNLMLGGAALVAGDSLWPAQLRQRTKLKDRKTEAFRMIPLWSA